MRLRFHRSTNRSVVAGKRPRAPGDRPRSLAAVLIATRQPLLTSRSPRTRPGSRRSSGTNTFSRNNSAKPGSPSSWAIGRTVTPGLRRSNASKVMPLCRWASLSGGISPNAQSAKLDRELPRLLAVEQPAALGAGGR